MLKTTGLILILCLGLVAAGCGSDDGEESASTATTTESAPEATTTEAATAEEPPERAKPKVEPPNGPKPKQLVKRELIPGTGAEAKAGDEVTVQYVGVGYETGIEFDSSWSRNEPFTFTLGEGDVIKGWDLGVEGMKVGGRRELVIPPDLAYGSEGASSIAPNATLVFVVDLLKVD